MKQGLIKSLAATFAVIAVLLPTFAMAAEFRGNESGATNINETINDDLYSAGSGVSLNAPVMGDAVLAGGTVLINGPVSGSVLAAGGTITIIGNVEKNIRVIGGNIFLNGNVGHDVVVLGGQITISPTASIGHDLIVLGGTVNLSGPVAGNLYVRGGEVTIDAQVSGSVDASSDALVLGTKAAIGGVLKYASPEEISIGSGTVKGGVEYKKLVGKHTNGGNAFSAIFTLGLFIRIISIFVLALIVTTVFKKPSATMTQNSFVGFGWNVLHGFSALVLVPVGALVLLVTILGAPFAAIAMSLYGIMLVLAGILAPIMVGAWIWKFAKKTPSYQVNIYTIMIGAVVYVFVSLIPVIGWVFSAAFYLAAVGVIVGSMLKHIREAREN